MINIMSGSNVTLNYGEGILDFVYADFWLRLKSYIRYSAYWSVSERKKDIIANRKMKQKRTLINCPTKSGR